MNVTAVKLIYITIVLYYILYLNNLTVSWRVEICKNTFFMFLYTDHEVHKGKCVLWQGSHTCKIKLTWLSPTNRLALFTSCSLHFKHFYLYFLPESHQWWFVKDINWSLSSCEMITFIYISLNAYKQVNVSYLAQIGFTGSRFFFSSMFFHCLFITCQKWNMHLHVWSF